MIKLGRKMVRGIGEEVRLIPVIVSTSGNPERYSARKLPRYSLIPVMKTRIRLKYHP
jgi:hypothetical protein